MRLNIKPAGCRKYSCRHLTLKTLNTMKKIKTFLRALYLKYVWGIVITKNPNR